MGQGGEGAREGGSRDGGAQRGSEGSRRSAVGKAQGLARESVAVRLLISRRAEVQGELDTAPNCNRQLFPVCLLPSDQFSIKQRGSAGCFPLPVVSDSKEAALHTHRAFPGIDKSSDLPKTTKPSFI